ncbi:MAG: A/G-specific adenine glycosylase [Clostridia bacterium]|nr:A/G-specific adenine glycosylase [Clostridia bacterium]
MPEKNNPLSVHLVSPLVQWYRQIRRSLPWREDKDPYKIWISEIMLQQTRIEAVIPYYHRFLAELPTPTALAEVDDDRLMKLWEGLGYYSRARNLKAAAKEIVSTHGGSLPADYASLRALKGIGDYTAGAIASIAFGLSEPAVDGNVLRVLMRVTGREDDIALAATKKNVTEWLRAIYPSGADAGDLTEGLMELGERVCIPAGIPKCAECPLRDQCAAYPHDLWQTLPKKSPKKEKRTEDYTVLLLTCQGKVALCKRPDSGLLAGLWEFPNLSGTLSEKEVLKRLTDQGLSPKGIHSTVNASHIFTHIVWQMKGFSVECESPSEDYTWVTPEELRDDYAIPTAFKAYQAYFLKENG